MPICIPCILFAVPPTGVEASLARGRTALERGLGVEATRLLAPLLRSGSRNREDELDLRIHLCQAWLLQGDFSQATSALGRPPEALKEPLDDRLLSNLWRLHGHLALAKGDSSRAIALQSRALRHGELAHDSQAMGLAHLELAHCYRTVGDSRIVHDHLTRAAAALHAAGDRRHLALVHSLSGVLLAQAGRSREAVAALRQGERLAQAIHADDVVARLLHNQANVALVQHEREQALALAERSVMLYETLGAGHGLSVALATLGQILVQLGDLERAEAVLTRSLEVRGQVKFHETTVAVFDTLTQIHLMRGSYQRAEEYLRLAREAYAESANPTVHWYEWSLRVLGVRLSVKRGDLENAVAMADALAQAEGVPPNDRIHAELVATEALVSMGRVVAARQRLEACAHELDPRGAPSTWGEFLRARGLVHESSADSAAAHHDFAQSASIFDLLGERYPAALSQLALARLATAAGHRSHATRYLAAAGGVFRRLGAERDMEEADRLNAAIDAHPLVAVAPSERDVDEALVRRLVDGAAFPDLLARELVAAVRESLDVDAVEVFSSTSDGAVEVVAADGAEPELSRSLAMAAHAGESTFGERVVVTEPLGQHENRQRACAVLASRPLSDRARRRLTMFATIARQGFELCGVRDQHTGPSEAQTELPLEPLLPGFICAGAAMTRLAEEIQRLQGNNLTVLITGESGTGKDLVARAIHSGSQRASQTFLPYNCTSVSRELADSQLFGHRKGSFTGALADSPGLIRSASGGTLFLDEIGDLPLDVQPKLLRFLEQGEILPIGEPRPLAVNVRVLAATNVDLEHRVSEGRFREDLYYRLSVIRVHVPPLRERREEIPHLITFFLREACERLGRPDVRFSTATLDLFAQYWWPGNVRQLRNEIQRAVAMSRPGGVVQPGHLSSDLAVAQSNGPVQARPAAERTLAPGNLADAVSRVEKALIASTLDRAGGNISESARVLGLTRRGLYLKMRRLGLEAAEVAHTK